MQVTMRQHLPALDISTINQRRLIMSSETIYPPLTENQIKNFVPTRLYIKRHSITGLKYFGKTISKNIEHYKGSGKYWTNHIKQHGTHHVENLWVSDWYYDPYELQKAAIDFSIENDILHAKDENGNKIWGNLVYENGVDGYNDRTNVSNNLSELHSSEEFKKKMQVTCEHCHKVIPKYVYTRCHGDRCLENPNISDDDLLKHQMTSEKQSNTRSDPEFQKAMKVTCEHCGNKVPKFVYKSRHGDRCLQNPNISEENIKLITEYNREISERLGSEEFQEQHSIVCEHCNKKLVKSAYAAFHGEKCKENPNRSEEHIKLVEERAKRHSELLKSDEYKEKHKVTCEFCKKDFIVSHYAMFHGEHCLSNPNRTEESIKKREEFTSSLSKAHRSKDSKTQLKKTCIHCGKTVSATVHDYRHGDRCRKNPNISKEDLEWLENSKKNMSNARKTPEFLERNTRTCQYCNKTIVGSNSNFYRCHGDNCKLNPNYIPKEVTKHKCPSCDKEYRAKKKMENHAEKCTGNQSNEPRIQTCEHCNKTLINQPGNFSRFHGHNCKYKP